MRAALTTAALSTLLLLPVAQASDHSVGTLLSCPPAREAPCLWAGDGGEALDAHALRRLLLARHKASEGGRAARNLQMHMEYLESACHTGLPARLNM